MLKIRAHHCVYSVQFLGVVKVNKDYTIYRKTYTNDSTQRIISRSLMNCNPINVLADSLIHFR